MARSTSSQLASPEGIKSLCMELDALRAACRAAGDLEESRRLAGQLHGREREIIRALLDAQRSGGVDLRAAVPLIGRLSSQREWGVES